MSDPVTNNFSLVLPTVGGDINLWGGVLNTGVITALDSVLSAVLAVSVTTVDVALTAAQMQNSVFALSGTLTGNRNLTIPLSPNSATLACAGCFIVDNQTSGSFNVTVKTVASGSTGVIVPQGIRTELYSDGTNVKFADDAKTYIVGTAGSPNGQLAGTTGTANNPPFPLAWDYTNKQLYVPVTSGDATTTVWNNLLIGSSPIPTALFTALVIKVASNTTVTVAAGSVSVTDGAGNYKTVVPPGTGTPINFGTNGANALDVGTIAAATWYYIWVIAKTDGTTACLASLSSTLGSLTFPAGYTYAGRVGAVCTSAAVAQLMGTWQFGRAVYYVLGLAQTSTLPHIASGVTGTDSNTTPTWASFAVSTYVPPTASQIRIIVTNAFNNGAVAAIQIAPSTSYGGRGSLNPPPFTSNDSSVGGGISIFSLLLESGSIYITASGSNALIQAAGWEDNL